MRARIQRWGNSLAIRIPRAYAVDLGVGEGAEVELELDDQRLVVTPVRVPPLEALVAGITAHNRHDAITFGRAEGDEAW